MNALLLLGSLVLTVPGPLQAGAATSNITPPLGTRIVGGFVPYPAEHIHDELHARCLVLDDGQTRLALVVCDLLGLHRSVGVEARRLIEKEAGIPPQNMLISATHTHSAGTALGHNRYANEQELDDYQRFVARRIADGVRRASNLLRPAEIAFTRVDVPEQVHNRRWLMREGTVPPNRFGKIDRLNPRGSRVPYQRMREVAEDVAGKVQAALDNIPSWQDHVTLDARSRELRLDWRTVEPELLEWAKAVEARAPRVPGGDVPVGAKFATERDWVQRLSYAGRIQLLAEAKGPALVPVQMLRIGDIAIGTSPCETFAEIGLDFTHRSPLPHSFIVSLAHGYIGYLPTPRHFELGGYETWPGTNYLEPEASVKMLDTLIEITAELAPQDKPAAFDAALSGLNERSF